MYKVVLKGLMDNSALGREIFLEKFAKAYKINKAEAEEFIDGRGGVIYEYDDKSQAERGLAFIEKIGGFGEIIEETAETVPYSPESSPAPRVVEEPAAPAKPVRTDLAAPEPVPGQDTGTRPCPKCGYPVAAGEDECPSCQIFISKYETMMKKKAALQAQSSPSFQAPAAGGAAAAGWAGYQTPGQLPSWDPVSGSAAAPTGAPLPTPGQYQYPQPPYAGQYQQAPGFDSRPTLPQAKNALIMAIVSFFCFGIILGPLSIYLGYSANETLKMHPEYKGSGLAIAAMLTGTASLLINLLSMGLYCGTIGEMMRTMPQ